MTDAAVHETFQVAITAPAAVYAIQIFKA